jgi:hypothetical protein
MRVVLELGGLVVALAALVLSVYDWWSLRHVRRWMKDQDV